MAKKILKTSIAEKIAHQVKWVRFLKDRLDSSMYKANVSKTEYAKTKAVYNKAKLRLKLLRAKA